MKSPFSSSFLMIFTLGHHLLGRIPNNKRRLSPPSLLAAPEQLALVLSGVGGPGGLGPGDEKLWKTHGETLGTYLQMVVLILKW